MHVLETYVLQDDWYLGCGLCLAISPYIPELPFQHLVSVRGSWTITLLQATNFLTHEFWRPKTSTYLTMLIAACCFIEFRGAITGQPGQLACCLNCLHVTVSLDLPWRGLSKLPGRQERSSLLLQLFHIPRTKWDPASSNHWQRTCVVTPSHLTSCTCSLIPVVQAVPSSSFKVISGGLHP